MRFILMVSIACALVVLTGLGDSILAYADNLNVKIAMACFAGALFCSLIGIGSQVSRTTGTVGTTGATGNTGTVGTTESRRFQQLEPREPRKIDQLNYTIGRSSDEKKVVEIVTPIAQRDEADISEEQQDKLKVAYAEMVLNGERINNEALARKASVRKDTAGKWRKASGL